MPRQPVLTPPPLTKAAWAGIGFARRDLFVAAVKAAAKEGAYEALGDAAEEAWATTGLDAKAQDELAQDFVDALVALPLGGGRDSLLLERRAQFAARFAAAVGQHAVRPSEVFTTVLSETVLHTANLRNEDASKALQGKERRERTRHPYPTLLTVVRELHQRIPADEKCEGWLVAALHDEAFVPEYLACWWTLPMTEPPTLRDGTSLVMALAESDLIPTVALFAHLDAAMTPQARAHWPALLDAVVTRATRSPMHAGGITATLLALLELPVAPCSDTVERMRSTSFLSARHRDTGLVQYLVDADALFDGLADASGPAARVHSRLRRVIELGVDPNATGPGAATTALGGAIAFDQIHDVEALLALGADPDCRPTARRGLTAVQVLNGAPLPKRARPEDGFTPRYLDRIRALLARHAVTATLAKDAVAAPKGKLP